MIVRECKYNPLKDLKPVDSAGWIDVASAYVKRTIPSDLVTQETDFNNIDDPDSIAGKPSDVFDALMFDKNASKVVSQAKDEGSKSE